MTTPWTRESILELSGKFTLSRILISAAELDLFSKIADGPKSVEELGRDHGWGQRGLRILLDALAAQELVLRTEDGRYFLAASLAPVLCKGTEETVLPMLLHRENMWKSWSNLTEIVKTGENRFMTDVKSRPTEDMEAFIGAMHVVGRDMAATIADVVDLVPFRRLIDVGGGSGTYTIAFLKKAPHMRATLMDLPAVAEMARTRLAEEGLLDRVDIAPGDFKTDPLPKGHDLALLSAIIHMNGPEANRDLYRRVYDCLIPGGAILIRDHVMEQSRTRPADGAIFAVNMLAATRMGNSYTLVEITQDLESTGFTNVRLIRDGQQMDQVVLAAKA
jgi:hypothetical protein